MRAEAKALPKLAATAGLPRLNVANGTLEALKWLALVLMAADHADKFLFGQALPGVFEVARIVMPLFGFVLAYNLARPGTTPETYQRTMKRLALFGLLASPMFVVMAGWWPLNILFTLLLSVALMFLISLGGWHRALAVVLFLVGGAFVEFCWPAVLACVGAWAYCRRPGVVRLLLWVLGVAALGLVNFNLWALVAFPIIFGASGVRLQMPRSKYLFYVFYPAHLVVLYGLQKLL